MRVLFCTGSPAGYMAPPLLGDEQICCGPDWPDEERNGAWVSLKTPVGEYDVSTILARLPAAQTPDVVVCLVDASWRNVPRGLGKFRGPKVLLVADTHHMATPVTRMLRYAKSEPFDRTVLLYDRHHLSIFHAAGVSNLHWFPGLTFPHDDQAVQSVFRAERTLHIAFVGQAAKHHPRRMQLLAALEAKQLPVLKVQLRQREALGLYGSSLVGFNASLNGDLNLRTFEVLASGAMLLTDRLAPESGLTRLWSEGAELVTYANTDELTERARYFIAHPAEAKAIGFAGAKWFAEHFSAKHRRDAFASLVEHGRSLPEFEQQPSPPLRISFPSDAGGRAPALEMYEHLQELHRVQETVRISLDSTVPEDVAQLCRTLPRIVVKRDTVMESGERLDFQVVDAAIADQPQAFVASRVWCWNAPGASLALFDRFAKAGFVPFNGSTSFFMRPDVSGAASVENKAAQAAALLQRGDALGAMVLARAAFAENPRSVDALVVLGAVAFMANNRGLAEKMVRLGLDVDPHDPRLNALAAKIQPPAEMAAS